MIAIIDYNAGNTRSVMNALDRLKVEYRLTANPDLILAADKIILPGVGHAGAAMQELKNRNLVDLLKGATQPFLGVCVGMQLLYNYSEEGKTDCLGIIPGSIQKFVPANREKVPHIGWNEVIPTTQHPLFTDIPSKTMFYHVHSYYAPESSYTIATSHYIQAFAAAVSRDNFMGVQFHPEKSAEMGEKIFKNFINL
jgi:imidazole glycerol-phosphate synthase subunit HisH